MKSPDPVFPRNSLWGSAFYLRDSFRQTRMPGPPAVAAGIWAKDGWSTIPAITELFGLAAQRHSSSCWAPDEPFSPPAGQVAEGCKLDAAIDLLPVGAQHSGNGGNCFPPGVGQKNSGPFDTLQALGPRSRRALQSENRSCSQVPKKSSGSTSPALRIAPRVPSAMFPV